MSAACGPVTRDPLVGKLRAVNRWFVLYNEESALPPAFRWENYDMAILDPDVHPDLARVPERVILIAYLSVGLATDYRSYWPKIKGEPWLSRGEGEDRGKYYVDVRDPAWERVLIDHVIPEIRQKGFQGIFLDTLGTPINREQDDPAGYGGSKKALVKLVGAIRRAYPDLMIISNNAFEILPDLAPFLSAAAAEAVHAAPGARPGRFDFVGKRERERKVHALTRLAKRHGLAVFIIDYVDANRPQDIQYCLDASRRHGFKPYIAQGRHTRFYEQGA
jgi:uncharacterized protein (TIGR01370 family)